MIEILQTSGSNQIEIRFSGHVGQADYETVLIPAIEAALAEHDQVRILAIMVDEFKGNRQVIVNTYDECADAGFQTAFNSRVMSSQIQ